MIYRNLLIVIFFLFCSSASALEFEESVSPWYTVSENQEYILYADLFMTSDCIYCKKLNDYFNELESKYAWLKTRRYMINKDKKDLFQFHQRLKEQKNINFIVPAIFFCDSQWFGFDSPDGMGIILHDALLRCHQQLQSNHALSPKLVEALHLESNASMLAQYMINYQMAFFRSVPIFALLAGVFPGSLFFMLFTFASLSFEPKKTRIFYILALILPVFVVNFFFYPQGSEDYSSSLALRSLAFLMGSVMLLIGVNFLRSLLKGKKFKILAQRSKASILMSLLLMSFISFFYQQSSHLKLPILFNHWLILQQNPDLDARQISLGNRPMIKKPESSGASQGYQIDASLQSYFFYKKLFFCIWYCLPSLFWVVLFRFLMKKNYILEKLEFAQFISANIFISMGFILAVFPVILGNLWISMAVLIFALFLGQWQCKKRIIIKKNMEKNMALFSGIGPDHIG